MLNFVKLSVSVGETPGEKCEILESQMFKVRKW